MPFHTQTNNASEIPGRCCNLSNGLLVFRYKLYI